MANDVSVDYENNIIEFPLIIPRNLVLIYAQRRGHSQPHACEMFADEFILLAQLKIQKSKNRLKTHRLIIDHMKRAAK